MPRIILQLSGLEAENGRVGLGVFLEELQSVRAALRRADELATGGPHAMYFQIVALSYSSPLTVELEPQTSSAKMPDVRGPAARIFQRHLSIVESGKLGEAKVDFELLDHIRHFVEPVGKKLQAATISVNEHRFDLTHDYVQKIDSALAPIEYCIGTLDGMLEQMNIHAGANLFTLYPVVGPGRVQCHFGSATRDKALSAMGRRVEITGRLAYRRDAPFPHEIDVQTIEIYPPADDLPNLRDLRGRAPDATGDLSSEDYIAELRSAW